LAAAGLPQSLGVAVSPFTTPQSLIKGTTQMKTQTTCADAPSSIEHPSHSIPEEIAESIRSFREANLAALNRQDEIAKLSRPNQAERGVIAEAH
jgi:hypothetical protein